MKADPEFQAALLQSLAICRDPKSVGAARKLLNSPDAGVRDAAAHAVAWTGNPAFIEPLRGVRGSSNEATHFEATDALLRLGDALARSGKTAEAVNVYTDLVKTEPIPALAGAALASLIRYADASAAETVTNAITGDKHAQFEPVAVAAFEARHDAPGADLLLAVYPATSPGVRTLLVGVMGRQRNAAFQETLGKALNDPAYRLVAANALADSRQPGAA
jgi:HEAT repeat protein